MTVQTIELNLPQLLYQRIVGRARKTQSDIQELLLDMLNREFSVADKIQDTLPTAAHQTRSSTDIDVHEEPFPSPEEVVAMIQATPPNPNNIRPAKISLQEFLRDEPDPTDDFDLQRWNEEWSKVELEMKEVTHLNAVAEGQI